MRWISGYDREAYEENLKLTSLDFTNVVDMTEQAPADEQDINIIMKRFGVKDGSVLPHWLAPQEMYGDFSHMPDNPVEAAELIRLGEVAFMTLPAEVRKNFESGADLYNWLNNPDNEQEAVKLGLLSSSTSSDKEPLVQPPENTPPGQV